MDSRKDQISPHQPLLSSLIVRPSDSGGGGGAGSDYEPGEVRLDVPPYSRSERYSDEHGYRMRTVSGSPVHRRDVDRRYSPDFDHPGDLRRRGFASGREAVRSPGRYRDYSPPYHRRAGGSARSVGRVFEGHGPGPGPFRGEGLHRNNPNVRPREGDWYCPDPLCGNLNFARRENCNNCSRYRYAPLGSPRRGGYGGPPPASGPPRRFPGPPMDRSPGRFPNGFRSPPRGWLRDGPRDFGSGGLPPSRHEGRFPETHMRRRQLDYPEEDFRDRGKFGRLAPPEWVSRDRSHDRFLDDRKGNERRPPSPPPLPPSPPPRGRWPERDERERSRTAIRGRPPPMDFPRESYVERDRDDRHSSRRDRIGSVY